VRLHIGAHRGAGADNEGLARAESVIAIQDQWDTGIGNHAREQHLIFERWRQADGSTRASTAARARPPSISRELVRLLGGEVTLHEHARRGQHLTLYLPRSPGVQAGVVDATRSGRAVTTASASARGPALGLPTVMRLRPRAR